MNVSQMDMKACEARELTRLENVRCMVSRHIDRANNACAHLGDILDRLRGCIPEVAGKDKPTPVHSGLIGDAEDLADSLESTIVRLESQIAELNTLV